MAAKQPSTRQEWPYLGKIEECITTHAHQLAEDARILQQAIQARQKGSNTVSVPGNKLLPLCKSIEALVEKFLHQTGVQAWVTHLNEISNAQQQQTKQIENQAKQIEDLAKAVNTAATYVTPSGSASPATTGYARVRSWAKVAAGEAEPPPATKTIRTWTSATGSCYQEFVTELQERAIIVKLHNSSREDGKAVKSWIQGKMNKNPMALAEHINWAIKQAANEENTITTTTNDIPTATTSTTDTTTKPYKDIQVHSAVFLKSGDIQIHTTFVAQAKILLAHADEWIKYVGNNAKVIIPTYGVIIHAIPTASFDPSRPKEMISLLQTLNADLIQHDKINYVGWLTKEGAAKPISSVVIEFTAPEPANRLIHAGCLWSNESHTVERYDRACKMKQCLRCQKYGHIATQCAAEHDFCGYCGDSHDTRRCPVRSSRGTPKCVNCQLQHPSWNDKCEYRKRERRRIDEALKNKTKYWPETIRPEATLQPATTTTTATIMANTTTIPTTPNVNDINFNSKAQNRNAYTLTIPQKNTKTHKPVDPIDKELASTAPSVSLADDGPAARKSKRIITPMEGLTPGKLNDALGTIRPAPVRRKTAISTKHASATTTTANVTVNAIISPTANRSLRRNSNSSLQNTINVANSDDEDENNLDSSESIQNISSDELSTDEL